MFVPTMQSLRVIIWILQPDKLRLHQLRNIELGYLRIHFIKVWKHLSATLAMLKIISLLFLDTVAFGF